MKRNPPTWEERASGVRILRLYRTDLNPKWPRVVILNLTAERFREFERNPLKFDKKYKLYPEQPILWISHCARPPHAKRSGRTVNPSGSDWTVAIVHGRTSGAASAGCSDKIV